MSTVQATEVLSLGLPSNAGMPVTQVNMLVGILL